MNRTQQNTVVSSDEWYTPRWVIDELGPFEIDPCSPAERPFDTAVRHITKEDDGLKQEWGTGHVWLNPPYSRPLLRPFVEKMAEHNDGIALLKNQVDNLLFQEVIFSRAASLLFMRHRIKFIQPSGATGSPFFGSVLVAFGRECDRRLRQCNIPGKYVVLNAV